MGNKRVTPGPTYFDPLLDELRRLCEARGGVWPEEFEEDALNALYRFLKVDHGDVVDRIKTLIREFGGRIELTHQEIADRIGTHRETVSRLLNGPEFAKVKIWGRARWAYGLAEDPPQDLRTCAGCRSSSTRAKCLDCERTRYCMRAKTGVRHPNRWPNLPSGEGGIDGESHIWRARNRRLLGGRGRRVSHSRSSG